MRYEPVRSIPGILNEHGVFINTEDVVLANEKNFSIIIELSEHNGQWRFGMNYQCGGSRTGAMGSSFAPSLRCKPYISRNSCVMAAKSYIREIIKRHMRECDNHENVKKLAVAALFHVPVYEQMSLFGGSYNAPAKSLRRR
jgi:hypothetical protein